MDHLCWCAFFSDFNTGCYSVSCLKRSRQLYDPSRRTWWPKKESHPQTLLTILNFGFSIVMLTPAGIRTNLYGFTLCKLLWQKNITSNILPLACLVTVSRSRNTGCTTQCPSLCIQLFCFHTQVLDNQVQRLQVRSRS